MHEVGIRPHLFQRAQAVVWIREGALPGAQEKTASIVTLFTGKLVDALRVMFKISLPETLKPPD
jgi:hypothetical protein